jgi:hypothetical protein
MDKRDACMLNNIHDIPHEENLCNEQGNVMKLEIVKGYNHVEKDKRMTNTYSISQRRRKWTKAVFPTVRSGHLAQLYSFYLHAMERKFHTEIFESSF